MALTKKKVIDKIEILHLGQIQVRQRNQILENEVEISSTFNSHILNPDFSGNLSDHDPKVQAICNAVWTDEVKTSWATFLEKQKEAV